MNKRISLLLKLGLFVLLGCLMGCSSLQSGKSSQDQTLTTRPDPKKPKSRPYVEIAYDGKQIDLEDLYKRGFRKVIVKDVQIDVYREKISSRAGANLFNLLPVQTGNVYKEKISSPAIKGTLLVTDELSKAYPRLTRQIENGRNYDLWLQLGRVFPEGIYIKRITVAYIEDIRVLRPAETIQAEAEEERARKAEEERAKRAAEEEAKKSKKELAERIIVKKYGPLFSSYSDYDAWRKRCDGKRFTRSLIDPVYSGVRYRENDIFIVEKYGLEIKDMQFTAGGGFVYLVGGLGHISGHSQLCYLISATQIPYLTVQGRSMITKPFLLRYIGQDQYREGYQVKTCDVFLAFAEGSGEYENYQSMMDDLERIEKNPEEYVYILGE